MGVEKENLMYEYRILAENEIVGGGWEPIQLADGKIYFRRQVDYCHPGTLRKVGEWLSDRYEDGVGAVIVFEQIQILKEGRMP